MSAGCAAAPERHYGWQRKCGRNCKKIIPSSTNCKEKFNKDYKNERDERPVMKLSDELKSAGRIVVLVMVILFLSVTTCLATGKTGLSASDLTVSVN